MDIEGRHLVSSGMDHSIKIWRLDKPRLEEAIAQSYTHNSNKPSEKYVHTVDLFHRLFFNSIYL